MDGIAWDGHAIVPLHDAVVPMADRGFLLGDGVFETLRAVGGNPFRMDDHMARLAGGLAAIGLDAELADAARDVVHQLLASAEGTDHYVRVQVSTGASEDIGADDGARVTGICKPFRPYPMTHYQRGIRVVHAPVTKTTTDPLSAVKSLSFLPYVVARRHAMEQAAHDALLPNEHGRIAEATTSNVFAVQSDAIHAPGTKEGALDGVTRRAILELADDTGLDVVRSLDVSTLDGAQEVFLTNTIGGVVPVTRIEEQPVGDGSVGDLSKRLGRALDQMVHE